MPNIPNRNEVRHALTLGPEAAIEYLENKGYAITWNWQAIEASQIPVTFTVSKVAKMDILQDIKGMLVQSLEEGLTFKEFKKQLIPKLESRGWAGTPKLPPSRYNTIYRTNMQSAYNVGRWKSFKEDNNRPIMEYVSILDGVTRPSHAKLNGVRKPLNDPFWDAYAPSNGFNCRCRLRALGVKQADQRGGITKKTPKIDGKTVQPDKGFDHNPAKSPLRPIKPQRKDYDKDIWKVAQPITYKGK